MIMSDNEIVRNYQEAKNKKAQIEILADMNCCQKKDICEVLSNNGVEIEGKAPGKRGRKPKSLILSDMRLEPEKIAPTKGIRKKLAEDLQKEKEKADPVRDQVMIELKDKTVWVQTDAGVRDRYDRLLGYIWLKEPKNLDSEKEVRAKMFNAKLLLEGYAQTMTIQPNVRYSEMFVKFQREAREAGKGLWK